MVIHVPQEPVTAFRVACEPKAGRNARDPYTLLPVWLIHLGSNRFLDSDLAFLHYQEQAVHLPGAHV